MPSVLACLALSASVCIGKPVITVNTYDSNINGVWDWYGGSTLSWDSTQDHTGDGGGSLYIQKTPAMTIFLMCNPFLETSGTMGRRMI